MKPNSIRITKSVYAIRDAKANIFNQPVLLDNDGVAIRAFGDMITSPEKSLMTNHPSDFQLCYLGLFDLETGRFDCPETGYIIKANGSDFVNKE